MKLVVLVVLALVLSGAFKGAAGVDLNDEGNAVGQVLVSVMRGIADTTVFLIPTVLEWVGAFLEQFSSAAQGVGSSV